MNWSWVIFLFCGLRNAQNTRKTGMGYYIHICVKSLWWKEQGMQKWGGVVKWCEKKECTTYYNSIISVLNKQRWSRLWAVRECVWERLRSCPMCKWAKVVGPSLHFNDTNPWKQCPCQRFINLRNIFFWGPAQTITGPQQSVGTWLDQG